MAGTEFSQGELETRCRDLAAGIGSENDGRAAAAEQCLPQEPGAGWWAWVQAYANLRLLHAQGQRPEATPSDQPGHDDARVTEALRGAPKRLRLIGHRRRAEGEAPETVAGDVDIYVYPKSYLALLECHAIGERLGWLSDRIYTLQQDLTDAGNLALHERALQELGYLQRKLAWIVTHPTPGLPYPEFPTEEVTIPGTFAEWSGWDHLALAQAFQEVNALQQTAVDRLLAGAPREDGQSRVNGWSVFFGSVAQELGEETVRVMRDRPLVSLLAQVRVAAAARAASLEHARDTRDPG